MNQNQPKQSNATHNQQKVFTANLSLPCPQTDGF